MKKRWSILTLITPGPSEPGPEAMQRILKPLVDDLLRFQGGLPMRVAGREGLVKVHLDVMFTTSDIPALRKLTGAMAYGPKVRYPCNVCWIKREDIPSAAGYKIESALLHLEEGPCYS